MEKKRKVFDEFDEHKHIIDLGKIDELEEDVLFAIDVKTYKQELDKAREEGRDSVLFPKFKREKNGTIKQDGWVNTFKFKDEKLNLYIWERVNMMSSNWHSEGGVVIVAKSLERAREIAKEHFNPEEEHSTLTDYDTTVFDTEPNRVFEVSSSEEYYCDFPDAGCC